MVVRGGDDSDSEVVVRGGCCRVNHGWKDAGGSVRVQEIKGHLVYCIIEHVDWLSPLYHLSSALSVPFSSFQSQVRVM